MKKLLEIKNLSVYFQDNQVVKNVNIDVKEQEVVGIVGQSGSGKSVTASSILGLLPYPKAHYDSKSSIKFNGLELLNNPNIRHIRGKEIGFIFQEPMSSLNPLHKIGKQITEAILIHQKISYKQALKETVKLLRLTGIKNAKQRLNSFPHELSGGQRQRVMIAMALANKPKILIADEPTTALDVSTQEQIINLLKKLQNKLGISIVFISHNLRLINKICNKVYVMHQGKIVEFGDIKKIFKTPKHPYTKELLSQFPAEKDTSYGYKVVLDAQNMQVTFPLKKNFFGRITQEIKAVDKVSFCLREGETLGIIGQSGCGKTTLGMSLVGLNNYSGKINPLDKISTQERSKKIQIVFQDPYNSLNPRMTVEQILEEGLNVHFPHLNKSSVKNKIIKLLQEVGLQKKDVCKYPHEFSGGQRQRIAIARALIIEPQILILDEPTSALDVSTQKQILELLQQIQKEKNLSYIFISHDLGAVKAMSDNIAVMKNGKFIEFGTKKDVISNPQEEYTKQLINDSLH